MYTAKKSLQEDVNLLTALLNEVLGFQYEPTLKERFNQLRVLISSERDPSEEEWHEIIEALQGLPSEEIGPLTRAFFHSSALANICELHHHLRHHRLRALADEQREEGGFRESLGRLTKTHGIDPRTIRDTLCDLQFELVLTAHPTEVSRRPMLQRHGRIDELLAAQDDDLTSWEKRLVDESLRGEITALWHTDELRRQRLTVEEEVHGGLLVLERSFWQAVPATLRKLDYELTRRCGRGLPLGAAPIRLGSWLGGDRVENPRLNALISQRVSIFSRWMAAELYLQEIEALWEELSLRSASAELSALIEVDTQEPYRVLLDEVKRRLQLTARWAQGQLSGEGAGDFDVYFHVQELREPLLLCWRSLHEVGAEQVARGRLLDILRRLDCFGLTLVRLDFCQTAELHRRTLAALTLSLGIGDYESWNEEKRIDFLLKELKTVRPLIPLQHRYEPKVQEVLQTFKLISQHPADSFGSYVVIGAETASDLLAPMLLMHANGIQRPPPVVPLFETLDALERAPVIFDRLLQFQPFQRFVIQDGGWLRVIFGADELNLDGGALATDWAIWEAQRSLGELATRYGLRFQFGHGRGSLIGQGADEARRVLNAFPKEALQGRLRVIEQGETMQAKYGFTEGAGRSLELYLAGLLEATLNPAPHLDQEAHQEMTALVASSKRAYLNLVHDQQFYPLLRSMTPLPELDKHKLSNRPRPKRRGVAALRGTPWSFTWSQCRAMLPLWLGFSEAVQEAQGDPARQKVLSRLVSEWSYLNCTLERMERSFAKADRALLTHYCSLVKKPKQKRFAMELVERCARSEAALLQVLGRRALLETSPLLQESYAARLPFIRPLNLLQVEILHRLRRQTDHRLESALLVTLNGIAAGVRNTE
ncbi:MAG: phosphoenolpyruvate carboxylase [Myxococcota bacterium]|nr:phosphoenolpyruvate carboxylase [Myxococcota bacterium]